MPDEAPETQPRPDTPSGPDEHATTKIPPITPEQIILQHLQNLTGKVDTLLSDKIESGLRMSRIESRVEAVVGDLTGRMETLETRQSTTSERVRTASDADLSIQAAHAAELVKNQERDRKIAETHELAGAAASKDDVAAVAEKAQAALEQVTALSASAATKTDLEAIAVKADKAIEQNTGLAESQQFQSAILMRVDRVMDFCARVAKHPLTRLIITLLTLLLGGLAAKKGLQ